MVDSLYIMAPNIVLVLLFSRIQCHFEFCIHLAGEYRAGCFTLNACWCHATCSASLSRRAVVWCDRSNIYVAISGHTQVLKTSSHCRYT